MGLSHRLSSIDDSNMHFNRKNDRADDARKVFQEVHRKHFDWPEAIWDAWVTFEHFHGTVEEINAAMDNIEKIRLQVNARRAKVSNPCHVYICDADQCERKLKRHRGNMHRWPQSNL